MLKRASKGRKPVRDKGRSGKKRKLTRIQRGLTPSVYSPYYRYYQQLENTKHE